MKIVIHAGMHKTGSSSIQDYFFKTTFESVSYARWTSSNHCALFVLLFEDDVRLYSYHGFKARGPEFCARLPELRQKWFAALTENLEQSRHQTFIFSAEDISGPSFGEAADRMITFFQRWTSEISLVAYVRSPLSFAASAFQQRLKGGAKTLSINNLWPSYRARFGMLEDRVGRDNVHLRLYDRESLVGGDVVIDFASVLGLDLTGAETPESNSSLSAEATALLFAQRSLGEGFVAGFSGAHAANEAFIDALRHIGSSKLTFADEIWAPVLEKNKDDLEWIEQRLGLSMRDKQDPRAIAISSEDDLLKLAARSYGDLERLLIAGIQNSERQPLKKTVLALDLLRKLHY